MRKVEAGTFVHIGFQLLPVITVISDLFAVRTDCQNAFQLLNLSREGKDPFSYPKAHPDLIMIERFAQEIIHPGACLTQGIVARASNTRKQDKVGVIIPVRGPDLLTQLEPIQIRHLPIADDKAPLPLGNPLPSFIPIGYRLDNMPDVGQELLQQSMRHDLVLGNKYVYLFGKALRQVASPSIDQSGPPFTDGLAPFTNPLDQISPAALASGQVRINLLPECRSLSFSRW